MPKVYCRCQLGFSEKISNLVMNIEVLIRAEELNLDTNTLLFAFVPFVGKQ